MGIAGLWPLLEPTCQPVSLESLEGKILAVDVSIWIYQAQLGYPGEIRCPHLALLVSRLCKLLYYKIRPVFVFDGEAVPSFKRRVLNERRLRKHADEVGLTHAKKRHLLDLASGPQTQAEIEAVKNKLTSTTSKRQRFENDLFDILPTNPVEVVDLSDDDEDIVVLKEKHADRDSPPSRTIDFLMDERERIRASRLKPSQIPSDSKSFSDFQLQRLLLRSRLNNHIQQLCENREPEIPKEYFPSAYTQHPLFAIADNDEEDSSTDESEEGEFYSKTTMIEEHAKRNVGHRMADPGTFTMRFTSVLCYSVILRTDDWSSDSGTDDFIDVPSTDSVIEQYLLEEKPDTKKEVEEEKPSTSQTSGAIESAVNEESEDSKPSSSKDVDDQWEPALEFLSACGFPWIEAPGEAEAQCVELERLGLVQGVVSDDSDVWAFGVKDVYRHLFSKTKNVQHYGSRIIQQSLGVVIFSAFFSHRLSQSEFVGIAILSGGDYSSGLAGVGVVNAIELLSEFTVARSSDEDRSQEAETISTLKKMEEWLKTFESDVEIPEPIAIRRKLRTLIKKNNEMDRIKLVANPDVVAAYFRPNVDKSNERFRWKSVDVEKVRSLLYIRLGWDDAKFERQTLIALQRWNDFITGKTSYQRHITSYTHKLQQSPDEQKTTLTKRVETALAKLAKKTGSSSNLAAIATQPPKPSTRKAPQRKGRSVKKRGRSSRCSASPQDLQLSEESDSDE
ncbi:XPG protein [Ancylostoma caninum]|uniref:XPG protein n=1 Tax=Ancylostoma caninum TaxID=29170 RepID=A0A368G623_ANCCA|nr:XPG protein [Ancylostoma caninum]